MTKIKINPEKVFAALVQRDGMPVPEAEYKFHGLRKWRFDHAWPRWKVALEVEGGVWTGGRHSSGAGFVKDIEKYNHAGAMGWIVLRCMPRTLATGETLAYIKAALRSHGWTPDHLPLKSTTVTNHVEDENS